VAAGAKAALILGAYGRTERFAEKCGEAFFRG